jgi:hypothetical protein
MILAACELVVDVDVPMESQQMTLNSFFTPDSVWSAKITLNRHILDDGSFKPVDDAFVVVHNEGQPVDTLISRGNGFYASDNGKPVIGASYEITATSPKWGTVSATSQVPVQTPIATMEFEVIDDAVNQGTKLQCILTFDDKSGERNFYMVSMVVETMYHDRNTGREFKYRQHIGLRSKDPSMNDETRWSQEGILFNDILIEGRKTTLTLDAEGWYGTNDPNRKVKYFFYLRTLSEHFYNYKTTMILQNNAEGDPFAQPVLVYNNVRDGFGIFAGYSVAQVIYEP